jgi:hypothetical protein
MEVKNMNTILEQVELTLDGVKPGVVDVPVDDIPDYLPRMDGGGTPGC